MFYFEFGFICLSIWLQYVRQRDKIFKTRLNGIDVEMYIILRKIYFAHSIIQCFVNDHEFRINKEAYSCKLQR